MTRVQSRVVVIGGVTTLIRKQKKRNGGSVAAAECASCALVSVWSRRHEARKCLNGGCWWTM